MSRALLVLFLSATLSLHGCAGRQSMIAPGQDPDRLVEAVAIRARAAGPDDNAPDHGQLLGKCLDVGGKVVLTVGVLALGVACCFAASKSSPGSQADNLTWGKLLEAIWSQ